MGAARIPQHALPLQVAAVCYRRRGPSVEFLLVNTNGGDKWTFPKGDPERRSHTARPRTRSLGRSGSHGHDRAAPLLPLHSLQRRLLETTRSAGVCNQGVPARGRTGRDSAETTRNPTWFSPDEAKKILAKGREVKYARELQAVVDRAIEKIGLAKTAAALYAQPVLPILQPRPGNDLVSCRMSAVDPQITASELLHLALQA